MAEHFTLYILYLTYISFQLKFTNLPFQGAYFCFRQANGTHQFGCSSDLNGNVGVLHLIQAAEDLVWIKQHGHSNSDYVGELKIIHCWLQEWKNLKDLSYEMTDNCQSYSEILLLLATIQSIYIVVISEFRFLQLAASKRQAQNVLRQPFNFARLFYFVYPETLEIVKN